MSLICSISRLFAIKNNLFNNMMTFASVMKQHDFQSIITLLEKRR